MLVGNKKKVLIVVDVQNDFVTGSLGTPEAQAIGKTGKDVIDYITDQIDKVVNDKEEDKK